MKITFITGNEAKVAQLSRFLKIPVDHRKIDLEEIQSLDLEEIVDQKAKQAYGIVKSPVLVEDVSLVYTALNGLPGPFIRWFLEQLGNTGLCRLINHYNKDRSATAKVDYAYFDGKILQIFTGEIHGKIAAHPRGENDFGWSPVFIPDGTDKTLAELSHDEYENFSMRKIALKKLVDYLLEKNKL